MVGERFVGAVDPALQFRVRLLASCGDPLAPNPEGLPMDAEDDFECEEGVFEGEPKQRVVGEGNTGAGQGAYEFLLLATVVVDEKAESISGEVEPEVKFQIKV